jgi:hypothetical protein
MIASTTQAMWGWTLPETQRGRYGWRMEHRLAMRPWRPVTRPAVKSVFQRKPKRVLPRLQTPDGRLMKFYVRHADNELMFPSFKDFQTMYRLKFVGPDDMVRRENSDRWTRVGDLPELRLTHSQTYGAGLRFTQGTWLLVGVFALFILFQLFFRLKPMLPPETPPQTAPLKPAHP